MYSTILPIHTSLALSSRRYLVHYDYVVPTKPSSSTRHTHSLPPLLHAQNLHQSHEDIDEVQLKADSFIDRVTLDNTSLCHACVLEHLLYIVKSKSSKDDKATVEPNVLSEHERSCCGGGDDHGRETGKRDDGDTGEERATEVEVFVCLCGGTDEGDGAHHTDGVKASTSQDGGLHEEERSQECGLSNVEGGPKGVLGDVAVIALA